MVIMEDASSPTPDISDSIIDFNLINELLYDGFWLEATHESSFLHPDPPNTLCPPFPNSETKTGVDQAGSGFVAESDPSYLEMDAVVQPADLGCEESQVKRTRLWVGPNTTSPVHPPISVKKRLVQAITCLKDSVRDKDVLIQIWIPVKSDGRQVLTTNNQPFSLNPNCKNLAIYRDVSQSYQFEAGEESKEFLGLPGRVFLNKVPEWTPDVRFFRREEYPRVGHAQRYDIMGSIALPVFKQGSGICLGVVEIITTHQKLDFYPELDNVCKALEAVDLESCNIPSPSNMEDGNEAYQGTLREMRNMLEFVCDTHKLPLAQVWASCVEQRKRGCCHSDARCISIVESACYVGDAQVRGFHEACCQQHLFKSEGVPGKAFLTNQPCLSEDITVFSRTEYSLAHHARVFNLCASAAIRLRSGTADFVLEFFLPLSCKGAEDQMQMFQSLSSVIQQMCQSLRVITDEELAQESASILDPKLKTYPTVESSQIVSRMDPKHKGKGLHVSSAEKEDGELKVTTTQDYSETFEHGQLLQESQPAEEGGSFSLTIGKPSVGSKTSSVKKQKKTNKTISLQMLRQYFAGSLKEAATSIGVCPTTLKRICRQHGILRWPSRKIKKVGHSLRKLQLVIDSVEGAEGKSIQLSSFYKRFPELMSPNLPVVSSHNQAEGSLLRPSKSPDSHRSSSRYCGSTGVKPLSSGLGDALSGMLKKAASDAQLNEKGQEKTKALISHVVGNFRVKAAFGEEKIRLSLQPHWGFEDLKEEVLRRFNIHNESNINLKYLDDDAEWVLLTCDDDLEECRDIHTSSNNPTVKLCVNHLDPGGNSFNRNANIPGS